MSARRFAAIAALAFLVMFVAVNVLANSWLRSWRIDLTQDQLYSISPGTQTILNQLSEPVTLTLYYSRDAGAAAKPLQDYAVRVREMLQTYAARSRGRVRFVEVNVAPFSEQEDVAAEAGLRPFRPYQGVDAIYFGLVGANAIDDTRAIPFFEPSREAFLEYELTRLIYELENPTRTRVGLITALPIDPSAPARGQQTSVFASEMARVLQVVPIAPDFTEIPDVDVLAIIHPGDLSQAQLFAIDQFILRRGRAFIAVDPASMMAQDQGMTGLDPFNPAMPAPTASTLEPLLTAWGVGFDGNVVLDGQNALPVRTERPDTGEVVELPQPLLFALTAEGLSRDDLMTAWLRRGINVGMAGTLNVTARPGVESITLARTSGDTMRIPAQAALARPTPFELAQIWRQGGGGRMETVAVRLSGALETAFPAGAPEGAAAPAQVLARSQAGAEIVIIADTDFLDDAFYIDPNSGAAAADNAAFALNAIDILGGSDALVSLRSRAPRERRMTMIDALERDAQSAIESREEELRADLAATEARLAQIQEQGRGSGAFAGALGAEMTPDEAAIVRELETRILEVRGQLRRTEREHRGDVSRLETLMVFINVWLAPLLVAGAGLFFFWRRQRRARQGEAR